jgi:hypothetical protein
MATSAEQQLASLRLLKEKLEKVQPRTAEIKAALRHHEEEIQLLEKQLKLGKLPVRR